MMPLARSTRGFYNFSRMPSATTAFSSSADTTPPDVSEFCGSHGIESYLLQAIALATASFAPRYPVSVELDMDCETGDQRIVIQAVVCLSPQQTLERYQRLVAQWVSIAPEHVRYFFSFSYDIRPQ
jgi:hypothetical protein